MRPWSALTGHIFKTIQGARFRVVQVTDRNVIVQPLSGQRRYDIFIPDELERTLTAYAEGQFFPDPVDLLHVGVRHERSSYVWGIVYALLIEKTVSLEPDSQPPSGLVKVDSSMVYALSYDEVKQRLEVVFWKGGIWCYEGVTPQEYQDLMPARSLGQRMRDIIEFHTGYELRQSRR